MEGSLALLCVKQKQSIDVLMEWYGELARGRGRGRASLRCRANTIWPGGFCLCGGIAVNGYPWAMGMARLDLLSILN